MLKKKPTKTKQIMALALSFYAFSTPAEASLSDFVNEHKAPLIAASAVAVAGTAYYLTGSSDVATAVTPVVAPMTSFPFYTTTYQILNDLTKPGNAPFFVDSTTLQTIVEAPSKATGWVGQMLDWLPQCYDPTKYINQSALDHCLSLCLKPFTKVGDAASSSAYYLVSFCNGTIILTTSTPYGGWEATLDALYQVPTSGCPQYFGYLLKRLISWGTYKDPALCFLNCSL
jgi:hypothetical protein